MPVIVDFYEGRTEDDKGRSLGSTPAQDDAWWEDVHDFIQWVFPTEDRSRYNPEAPTLTSADIALFRVSPAAMENLVKATRRVRTFWGLDGTSPVRWTRAGDHNHLRMTRAIRCLRLLGHEGEARRLFDDVVAVASKRTDAVSKQTIGFWEMACM